MPYRRLPKTDAARLKALKTVIDNNELYTAQHHFIDWKTLSAAQSIYDKLNVACETYRTTLAEQVRRSAPVSHLQHNAEMYLSHFVQVLFFCIQRGEIKQDKMPLYGLEPGVFIVPSLRSADDIINNGKKIIEGEKERIKGHAMPIYSPSIAKVAVHYDIFCEAWQKKQSLQKRTSDALAAVEALRIEADEVLLDLWDQIEAAHDKLSPTEKIEACSKYGVVYYLRREEKKKQ